QANLPGRPQPALSPAELTQLNEKLKYWDVFITLVAKQAALATNNDTLREQLLSVLLNARHEILEVLVVDNQQEQDPVRQLFLHTWSQLAPLLRQISLAMPGDSALDFVGFIGAVDALQAIDAVGPSLNLDISSDGLRRLARMITPSDVDDPLLYDERVDPELRRLFDFGPPLELLPEPEPLPPSGLNWLIKSAWAQDSWDRKTIFKLNKWIPTKDNLHGYLLRVRWLLEDVVFKVLRDNPLEDPVQQIFHPLVLASAWQETCWRQFIEKDGERKPLKSSIGAVGIMQVSPRVWRGFYHPKPLTWNIQYNANAGGEILHHYLTHYAIRKQEHKRTNNIHDLARATYAAYNGGPSHLTRYRRKNTSKRLKSIDQGFWHKYQLIRDGDTLAVKQCYS
ncbi:MAG: lytic transglycosylase domain-containing protein, partial [Arenicellales bacterium]|nr:lytic transglycosylase domain-containing protein [Arenicellales bacterium]